MAGQARLDKMIARPRFEWLPAANTDKFPIAEITCVERELHCCTLAVRKMDSLKATQFRPGSLGTAQIELHDFISIPVRVILYSCRNPILAAVRCNVNIGVTKIRVT